MKRAVRPDENSFVAHPVHEVRCLALGRLERLSITHELDAEEEAGAAHVADERVTVDERPQPVEQTLTDPQRVLLQLLVPHDVEHGVADRARHLIPTERREVLHAVGERLGDVASGDDRRQRMTIA